MKFGKNIFSELLNSFQIHKNKDFLISEDHSIHKTYEEFFSDVEKFSEFKLKKLKKNAKVLILLEKKYDTFMVIFACLLAQKIAIPADSLISKNRFLDLKKKFKPDLILKRKIVNSKKKIKKKQYILSKEKFLIMQTSGTTGESKGIVFNNVNYLKSAKYFQKLAGYNEKTCLYHCLPVHFNAGILNLFFSAIFAGSKIVFSDKIDAIKILNFWETPFKFQCNSMHLVPSLVEGLNNLSLVENRIKDYVKNVQSIYSTGSYLYTTTQEKFYIKYKRKVQSVYGVTEIGGPITLQRWEDTFEENNIGTHNEGVKIKIIKKNEKTFIYIKTIFMMDGYYINGVFSKIKLSKGYYKTDDVGYYKNKILYFYGRESESIKKYGEMISLKFIENIAIKHQNILQVAATSKPNILYGDLIYLFVVLKKLTNFEINIKNIFDYLSKHLKKIELPSKIIAVPDLPKTTSGKVKKNLLNKLYILN